MKPLLIALVLCAPASPVFAAKTCSIRNKNGCYAIDGCETISATGNNVACDGNEPGPNLGPLCVRIPGLVLPQVRHV